VDLNFVGAILGALTLLITFSVAFHRKHRGQRAAIIGLGLALFAIPTYFFSVAQGHLNDRRSSRETAQAARRLEDRFDKLDGAYRDILSVLTDPSRTPRERQVAVAAAVGRYNSIAARLSQRPIRPLVVPLGDRSKPMPTTEIGQPSPKAGRPAFDLAPATTATPTPSPSPTSPRTRAEESSPPPPFVPPPIATAPVMIPPPIIVPPPAPPPP